MSLSVEAPCALPLFLLCRGFCACVCACVDCCGGGERVWMVPMWRGGVALGPRGLGAAVAPVCGCCMCSVCMVAWRSCLCPVFSSCFVVASVLFIFQAQSRRSVLIRMERTLGPPSEPSGCSDQTLLTATDAASSDRTTTERGTRQEQRQSSPRARAHLASSTVVELCRATNGTQYETAPSSSRRDADHDDTARNA